MQKVKSTITDLPIQYCQEHISRMEPMFKHAPDSGWFSSRAGASWFCGEMYMGFSALCIKCAQKNGIEW